MAGLLSATAIPRKLNRQQQAFNFLEPGRGFHFRESQKYSSLNFPNARRIFNP
jgi:hypothetical protein